MVNGLIIYLKLRVPAMLEKIISAVSANAIILLITALIKKIFRKEDKSEHSTIEYDREVQIKYEREKSAVYESKKLSQDLAKESRRESVSYMERESISYTERVSVNHTKIINRKKEKNGTTRMDVKRSKR